jgi:hypothetical protein
MASPTEAQLILCDAAVADPAGKVQMLGAGWSITSTPTAPHAVAVLMKVPWDRSNQKLPMKLDLLDSDGHPVVLAGNPITAGGEIEVGRPPGLAAGSMLDAAFALNVPSLPLQPGRYDWRLDFAGTIVVATFTARPA